LSRDTNVGTSNTGYEQQENSSSVDAVLNSIAQEGNLNFGAQYTNGEVGEVYLEIMKGQTDVQKSNYNSNSFKIRNIGGKTITAFFLDTTGAVLGDAVFDPVGTAGDSVSKPLVLDRLSEINVLNRFNDPVFGSNTVGPNTRSDPFVFLSETPIAGSLSSGTSGFRGMILRFGQDAFTTDSIYHGQKWGELSWLFY